MSHYRVFLRGENFLLRVDDQPTRMGFYTTRFVEAESPEEAELAAVALLRTDEWLRASVLNEASDRPVMHADEIELVEAAAVPAVAPGYSFFSGGPEEGEND
jgi:hypothetical protein